jgi:hypothetical protein
MGLAASPVIGLDRTLLGQSQKQTNSLTSYVSWVDFEILPWETVF